MSRLNIEDDEDIQLLNDLSSIKVELKKDHHEPDQKDAGTSTNTIELLWRNLSYTILERSTSSAFNINKWKKRTPLQLLSNLNGTIESGRLTAIIGPSGAGKTTLMECLSGWKQNGVTGKIMVNQFSVTGKIKIAYNSQYDCLMKTLTVKETLLFASKLKNNETDTQQFYIDSNFNYKFINYEESNHHPRIVMNILKNLGLEQCADTRVSDCSGGQLKRLSIAVELISSPSILLLDEPTSGLDSVSCHMCVSLLKKLTQCSRPMVIAASIHQPTARILSYFDHLYVLAVNGQCIYEGSTAKFIGHLLNFNIRCPEYHNPADFAIEIASGDHGAEIITKLGSQQESAYDDNDIPIGSVKIQKIFRRSRKMKKIRDGTTTKVLLLRSFFTTIREPIISWMRLIGTSLCIFLIGVLYTQNKTGINDGCFEIPSFETIKNLHVNPMESSDVPNNLGYILISVIFVAILSSMGVVLSFPMEMPILIKESYNGWYGIDCYFLARTAVELPLLFLFPAIYVISTYYMTAQIDEFWRLSMFFLIIQALAFASQGFGFMISGLYANDLIGSAFSAMIFQIPLILFTGIFVRISSVSSFVLPFTYLSWFRLAFEASIITIYGFDRCPSPPELTIKQLKSEFGNDIVPLMNCIDEHNPDILINATHTMQLFNENLKSKGGSWVMQSFSLSDNDLYVNIGVMIGLGLVLRVLAFLVLYWNTNKKR